ncbi:MAG TPA: HAMP domain-containing sensor histidine kinase [Polyangiaceae bacterium]|nr:HAMP domain-containing sensor histidine kinase [Polyangiaceae bacterium]
MESAQRSSTPGTPPTSAVGPATGTTRVRAGSRARGAWPLLPLAPGVVILVGLAVAFGMGLFGVSAMADASDDHAAARADLLASTLAARIAELPPSERLEAMQRAARKTGAEFVVVSRKGDLVLDASLGMANRSALRRVVGARTGEAITGLGRTRFATGQIDAWGNNVLVAFVREPVAPEAAPALIRALVALTTLLVGIAAAVAYAVGRDANRDVDFVGERVRGMVHVRSEPAGEAVPVRTMDEVGALTVAFNALVERFAAAQSSYQSDLERVRAADRDRAAFLAAVSHELRSPLNAILGFADVLMAEVDGPLSDEAREEVEQIRGSGKHLLDLINDILELSALESGQLRLAQTRVDLGAVAGEVVREAAGLVGARPVDVRIEGEAGVYARGDPKRVRQVLTNLVGNAVKFTQRGEVVVVVGREGAQACLAVRDTGPGISPQERAMIFQEYKQTKEERTRRRGTGLGLAMTRRLVAMHGGTIEVASEVGHGSVFKVLLPAWPMGAA